MYSPGVMVPSEVLRCATGGGLPGACGGGDDDSDSPSLHCVSDDKVEQKCVCGACGEPRCSSYRPLSSVSIPGLQSPLA